MSEQNEIEHGEQDAGTRTANDDWVMSEIFAEHGNPTTMDEVREMVEKARRRGSSRLGAVPTGAVKSAEQWDAYARWVATFACEVLFPIRRGVILDSARNVAIYFDNNPVKKKRPAAQAAMVMALDTHGVALVAMGASPDDYTTAHVFRGWRNIDVIRSVISQTIRTFGIGYGEIGTHMS